MANLNELILFANNCFEKGRPLKEQLDSHFVQSFWAERSTLLRRQSWSGRIVAWLTRPSERLRTANELPILFAQAVNQNFERVSLPKRLSIQLELQKLGLLEDIGQDPFTYTDNGETASISQSIEQFNDFITAEGDRAQRSEQRRKSLEASNRLEWFERFSLLRRDFVAVQGAVSEVEKEQFRQLFATSPNLNRVQLDALQEYLHTQNLVHPHFANRQQTRQLFDQATHLQTAIHAQLSGQQGHPLTEGERHDIRIHHAEQLASLVTTLPNGDRFLLWGSYGHVLNGVDALLQLLHRLPDNITASLPPQWKNIHSLADLPDPHTFVDQHLVEFMHTLQPFMNQLPTAANVPFIRGLFRDDTRPLPAWADFLPFGHDLVGYLMREGLLESILEVSLDEGVHDSIDWILAHRAEIEQGYVQTHLNNNVKQKIYQSADNLVNSKTNIDKMIAQHIAKLQGRLPPFILRLLGLETLLGSGPYSIEVERQADGRYTLLLYGLGPALQEHLIYQNETLWPLRFTDIEESKFTSAFFERILFFSTEPQFNQDMVSRADDLYQFIKDHLGRNSNIDQKNRRSLQLKDQSLGALQTMMLTASSVSSPAEVQLAIHQQALIRFCHRFFNAEGRLVIADEATCELVLQATDRVELEMEQVQLEEEQKNALTATLEDIRFRLRKPKPLSARDPLFDVQGIPNDHPVLKKIRESLRNNAEAIRNLSAAKETLIWALGDSAGALIDLIVDGMGPLPPKPSQNIPPAAPPNGNRLRRGWLINFCQKQHVQRAWQAAKISWGAISIYRNGWKQVMPLTYDYIMRHFPTSISPQAHHRIEAALLAIFLYHSPWNILFMLPTAHSTLSWYLPEPLHDWYMRVIEASKRKLMTMVWDLAIRAITSTEGLMELHHLGEIWHERAQGILDTMTGRNELSYEFNFVDPPQPVNHETALIPMAAHIPNLGVEKVSSKKDPTTLSARTLIPDTIFETLSLWRVEAELLSKKEDPKLSIAELHLASHIRKLQIPQHGVIGFWDKVDPADITNCLGVITQLMTRLQTTPFKDIYELQVASFTLLAIADRLKQRLSQGNLNPYHTAVMWVQNDHATVTNPYDVARVRLLSNYFVGLNSLQYQMPPHIDEHMRELDKADVHSLPTMLELIYKSVKIRYYYHVHAPHKADAIPNPYRLLEQAQSTRKDDMAKERMIFEGIFALTEPDMGGDHLRLFLIMKAHFQVKMSAKGGEFQSIYQKLTQDLRVAFLFKERELLQHLHIQEFRYYLAHQLLAVNNYVIPEKAPVRWNEASPWLLCAGGYVIDLDKGTICPETPALFSLTQNKDIQKLLGDAPLHATVEEGVYQTEDARVTIVTTLRFDGDFDASIYLQHEGKRFSSFLRKDGFGQWVEISPAGAVVANPIVLSTTDLVLTGTTSFIRSIDNPTLYTPTVPPIVEEWVNLATIRHHLYPLMHFCDLFHITCLVSQGQIKKIRLGHDDWILDVSNDTGQMQATHPRYPGFHVAHQQALPALTGFSSYLVLENGNAEKKVIMQADQVVSTALGAWVPPAAHFLRAISLPKEGMRFHEYSIDHHGKLTSEDPASMAYLLAIYATRGEARDVLRCCNKLEQLCKQQYVSPHILNLELLMSLLSPQIDVGALIRLRLFAALSESSLLHPEVPKEEVDSLVLMQTSFIVYDLTAWQKNPKWRHAITPRRRWFLYQNINKNLNNIIHYYAGSKAEKTMQHVGWDSLVNALGIGQELMRDYMALSVHFGTQGDQRPLWIRLTSQFIGAPTVATKVKEIQSPYGKNLIDTITSFQLPRCGGFSISNPMGFSPEFRKSHLDAIANIAEVCFFSEESAPTEQQVKNLLNESKDLVPLEELPLDVMRMTKQSFRQAFLTYFAIARGQLKMRTATEATVAALMEKREEVKRMLKALWGGWDAETRLLIQYLTYVMQNPNNCAIPNFDSQNPLLNKDLHNLHQMVTAEKGKSETRRLAGRVVWEKTEAFIAAMTGISSDFTFYQKWMMGLLPDAIVKGIHVFKENYLLSRTEIQSTPTPEPPHNSYAAFEIEDIAIDNELNRLFLMISGTHADLTTFYRDLSNFQKKLKQKISSQEKSILQALNTRRGAERISVNLEDLFCSFLQGNEYEFIWQHGLNSNLIPALDMATMRIAMRTTRLHQIEACLQKMEEFDSAAPANKATVLQSLFELLNARRQYHWNTGLSSRQLKKCLWDELKTASSVVLNEDFVNRFKFEKRKEWKIENLNAILVMLQGAQEAREAVSIMEGVRELESVALFDEIETCFVEQKISPEARIKIGILQEIAKRIVVEPTQTLDLETCQGMNKMLFNIVEQALRKKMIRYSDTDALVFKLYPAFRDFIVNEFDPGRTRCQVCPYDAMSTITQQLMEKVSSLPHLTEEERGAILAELSRPRVLPAMPPTVDAYLNSDGTINFL